MRELIGVLAAIALASPTIVLAQPDPLEIAFDDCPGAPGALPQKVDACASNVGQAMSLVVSFVAPVDIPEFVALTAVIRVGRHNQPLPLWWGMVPGGCRQGMGHAEIGVSDVGVCADPWGGSPGFSSILFEEVPSTPSGSSFLQMTVEVGLGQADPLDLQTGVKYQLFTLSVPRTRSIGPDACPGCCEGVCIIVDRIRLFSRRTPFRIDLSNTGTPAVAYWQGAAIHTPGECIGVGCPVPVRKSTWGDVKALYR
jgi:hypothetical protein